MRNTVIMLITAFISLSFFTIILPVETCVASGNTIYVDDDNTEEPWDGTQAHPYQDIQDGIDAADESGGDTVYVYGGEYNKKITIDRPLTLTGAGSGITTISGSGDHTIRITANSVSISGFTIKNTGGSSSFSSVFLSSVSSSTIQNNIIRDGGNGVYLVSSNSNTIKDNTVEYNNIGIYLSNSDSNTIRSNTIQHNNANGVFLPSTSSSNAIYLNHFSDNTVSNARDQGSNSWSYGTQGNYWDDYTGSDILPPYGIGDIPYNIPGGSNQDMYPLGCFPSENQKPIATIDSISPSTVTRGEAVSFSGRGTDPDPDDYISSYNWRSDRDGQLSTLSSFSKSTLSVGTHTIYFKVIDNHGAESTEKTAQVTVTQAVNQKPTAQIVTISPNPATYGDLVYFHGLGIDNNGGIIVAYNWCSNISGFLNGNSTFTKSNLSVGIHTIYFKVRNNMGEWSDEISASLVIKPGSSPPNEPPTADAGGPYSGYVNALISFNGSRSTDDGTITLYKWDFGDGTTVIDMSPTHTYTQAKNYTVTLTVTDDGGKNDTDTTYANVSIQPVDQNGNGEKKTPDFEIITVIISITLILLWRRRNL